MATLCLVNEKGMAVNEWVLDDRPLTIGRGMTASARIEDDGISRRHFMIRREGNHFVLRDLSSRNGTWVDGERSLLRKLNHGDRIFAGRSEFRFRSNLPSSATQHEPAAPRLTETVTRIAQELRAPFRDLATSYPAAWL